MKQMLAQMPISFWAAATEVDNQTWQSMAKADQLAALQALANQPEASEPTSVTIAEIRARVRNKHA